MFSTLDIYRKINFIFDKKYSSYVPLLFLFIFLTILEIASLGLILPYMNLIFNPDLLFENKLFQNFFTISNQTSTEKLVLIFSLIFGLIFMLKTFFMIFVRANIQKFSLENHKNLQIKLMKTYQSMNYNEFIKKKHSEYIRNIRELSAHCMTCLEMGLRIISEVIVILSIAVFLLFVDPISLLITSSIIFLSILLYNLYLKPLAVKWGVEKDAASKVIYQSVDESFKGFKELKSLQKQNFFSEYLKKGANLIFKNDLKSSIIISSPRYFLELVLVLFILAYLAISILSQGIQFNFFPTLAIFGLAALRILPSASLISNGILMIAYCTEPLNVIFKDLKNNKIFKNIDHGKKLDSFQSIELKNVSFFYENSQNKILESVNLKLNKNEFVGFIGGNGSGKTTLIDILLGFLKPTEGKIFVNSYDLDPLILNDLNKIGYLPQENFIINDTLESNITLDYDKTSIQFNKLEEIISLLKLNEFVDSLPNKMETLIGENGIKLSGGERQKVCLARLLYHDKEILVLDEATNALDKKSEEHVFNSLKSLKNKTIIIITHDHYNLRYCDKLYRIKNGKLESGNIK